MTSQKIFSKPIRSLLGGIFQAIMEEISTETHERMPDFFVWRSFKGLPRRNPTLSFHVLHVGYFANRSKRTEVFYHTFRYESMIQLLITSYIILVSIRDIFYDFRGVSGVSQMVSLGFERVLGVTGNCRSVTCVLGVSEAFQGVLRKCRGVPEASGVLQGVSMA